MDCQQPRRRRLWIFPGVYIVKDTSDIIAKAPIFTTMPGPCESEVHVWVWGCEHPKRSTVDIANCILAHAFVWLQEMTHFTNRIIQAKRFTMDEAAVEIKLQVQVDPAVSSSLRCQMKR